MKSSTIREMTDEELVRAVEDSSHEILNLRLQSQTSQLENTARVRQVKKDLARLLTEKSVRSQQSA